MSADKTLPKRSFVTKTNDNKQKIQENNKSEENKEIQIKMRASFPKTR